MLNVSYTRSEHALYSTMIEEHYANEQFSIADWDDK